METLGFVALVVLVGQISITGMLVTAYAFKVLAGCGCKKGK